MNERGLVLSILFHKDSAGCPEKTAVNSADTPAQKKRGSLPTIRYIRAFLDNPKRPFFTSTIYTLLPGNTSALDLLL